MTMKAFQRLEESFQDVARSTKAGEGRVGTIMLKALDDYVESLPQGAFDGLGDGPEAATNWMKGKEGWAHHKRTKTVEDAIYNARLSGNFPEGLRGELRTILKSDKKRRGFTPDELEAMEAYVMGGPVNSMMKALAQGGGLPGAAWGALAGGPVGAVGLPAASAAAKAGIDSGAKKTAAQLRAQVASGGLPQPAAPQNLSDLERFLSNVGPAPTSNVLFGDERDWLANLLGGAR